MTEEGTGCGTGTDNTVECEEATEGAEDQEDAAAVLCKPQVTAASHVAVQQSSQGLHQTCGTEGVFFKHESLPR